MCYRLYLHDRKCLLFLWLPLAVGVLLTLTCSAGLALATPNETAQELPQGPTQLDQRSNGASITLHFERKTLLLLKSAVQASHEERWGLAKAYLVHSLMLYPWTQEADQLWQYLSSQSPIKKSFEEEEPLDWLFFRFLLWLPTWLFSLLTLITVGIFIHLFLHSLRFYRLALKTQTKWEWPLGKLVAGGMLAILLLTGLGLKWYYAWTPWGIVTQDADLRSFHEDSAPVLATVKEGTRVKIHTSAGDWLLVSKGNATTGWLNKSSCYQIHVWGGGFP